MENLIGKLIRDKETGDVGKILKYEGRYYLVKWLSTELNSRHKVKDKDEYYAKYTLTNIQESGRFEYLTGAEALVYAL